MISTLGASVWRVLSRVFLARTWRVLCFLSTFFRTQFTCERGWYLFIIFHFALLHFARSSRANGVDYFSFTFFVTYPPSRSKFTRERGCFFFVLVSGRYFCSRGGRVGIYTVFTFYTAATSAALSVMFTFMLCFELLYYIIILFYILYYIILYRLYLI